MPASAGRWVPLTGASLGGVTSPLHYREVSVGSVLFLVRDNHAKSHALAAAAAGERRSRLSAEHEMIVPVSGSGSQGLTKNYYGKRLTFTPLVVSDSKA